MKHTTERTAGERARSRRGEGARLRTELLDAAAELIAEHGSIDKVGVRAVANTVGVSPTAVYRHFDDTDELLVAAVEHCWTEFRDVMVAAAAAGTTPFDRLERSGHAYLAFAFGNRGKYRVLFSNRVSLPIPEEPPGMEAFDLLVDIVAAILRERDDDRDPFFVAVQVHTWLHGICDLCANHPGMPWPAPEVLMDEMAVCLRLRDP